MLLGYFILHGKKALYEFVMLVKALWKTQQLGSRTENLSDEALPEEKKKRTVEIKTIPKITKELRT